MEYERIELPQPQYGDVAVLRIGNTLFDTGHPDPNSKRALREALDGPLDGIERVVHTHPHVDHVGGSQTVDALSSLPHVVPAGSVSIIQDYETYLRRAREDMARLQAGFGLEPDDFDRYFPVGVSYAEENIPIDRELEDGDVLSAGNVELEVVSTPGHADPHLGFYHEPSGTYLSGDLVDPDGRFQYGPLLADVGEYKSSLRRVRSLSPDRLVPMHGPPSSDPATLLERSLENAEATERRLLAYLDRNDRWYAREFVAQELGITDERAPFLTLVIYEYLRHLEDRMLLDATVTDDGILVE